MNKEFIVQQLLAKHPNLTEDYVKAIVDIILDNITNALLDDKEVVIRNFGKFHLRTINAKND